MDLPFGIWLLFIGLIWVAEAPLPGGRGDSLQLGNPQDHAVVAGNPPEDDEILRINQELIPPEAPESSFLLEGDIIKVSPFRVFSSASPKWPKRRGIVQIPYVLSYKYDKQSVKVIKEAFADFAKFTCIKFVPYSYQRDFISVTPMSGCFSSVGRTGGMQVVSLVPACLRRGKGVALHELMHVVGFWHEHSRADRDKYISISWNEILTGFEINFMKSWTSNMLVTYDYSSVLHYGRYAFSMTGLPTITPLSNPYAALGQRWNLSSSDIARVNKLYKCSRTGADAESPSTIKENIKDFISNELEPCPTEGETKVSTTSPISRASSPGTNPHETAQSAWRPSKQMSAPTAATEKLMGRTAMNDEELRVSLTPVQGVQSVKFAPTGLSTHGITYLEATGKTPSTHIEMGTAEAEGKHLIPMEETSLLGTVSSQEPDFTTVMLSPESQPSPRKVTSYHGKVAEGLGTTKIPTETLAGLEFPELVSSGVAPVEMGGTRPSETTSVQEMELAYHSTYLAQKGPSPATEIRVVPLTSNQTWSLETPTELAPPEITSSLEVSSGTYMPVMHTAATLALGQTPPMQVSAIETSHLISTEKWTTNLPRLTSAKTTKAPTRARSAPTGQTPSVEMETTTVAYATEKTSLFPITPNWTSSPTKQRIQSVAHQAYTPESQEQNTIAISASGLTKTEPTEAMQPTSLTTFEMAENPTSSPELQFPLFATTKHKKSASLSSLGIETSSIEPPTKVITFMETQTELGFVDATRIKASGQHGFPSLPEGTYFPVSKVKDDEYATETGTLPVTWVSEPAEMSMQTTANYRNQERIHTTTIRPTYTPSLGESENPATHPQNAGPEEATGSKDQSQATLSTRSSTEMGVQEARNTSPKQRRGHTYTLASVLTSSTAPELKFMEHPTRNFHGTSSPLSQAPEVTFPTETSTTNAAEMGVQEAINPLRKRSRWVSHTAHSTEQTSMAATELTYATFSAEPAQPTIHSGYRETAEVLGTEAGNQLSLSVSSSRMELGAQEFKGVQEAESYKKKGRVYIHTHAPVRERSPVVTEQSSKTVLATKAIKTQTRVRMETHVQEMEGRSTVPTTEGMLPVASETTKAGYPFPEAFGTPTTNVTEVGSGKEAPSSPREGSGGETPIRMPATATEMHSGLSSKVASTPGSLETRTISIPESATTGILASLKKAGARTEQTEAVHLPGTEVVHGQFLEAQTKTTLQAVVGLQGAKSHGTQGKGFVPIEGTKATYVMSSLEAAEAPVTNPHSRTANTTDIGASLQDTSYILRSTEMQQEAASNYGKEGGHTFAATPAGTQPVRSESGHLGHPTERTLVQETQSIRSRGGEATETASTQTKAQNLSHTKEGTSIAKTAMEAVHSTRGALLLETPENQTLKLREVAMKAETSLYGEEEGLTTHLLPSVTLSAETAEQVQSTEVRELILPENWPTGHPELGTSKHTTNKTRTGEEHTSLTSMGKLPSLEANTTKLVYPTEEASLLRASPHQTFSPTEWEIRTTSSQETPAMIFPREEHGQSPMSPGGMQPAETEALGLFTQTTSTWSPETPTWRLEEVSVFHRKKGRGKPSPLPTGTAQPAESETSKAFIPNAILVDAMEGQTTSQTVLGITKASLAQLLGSSRHAERASFPGAEATEAVIKVPRNGTETQTALPNKTRELIPTARTQSVGPEAMGQSYSTTMKAVKTPSSLSERMLYTATSSHRKAWPPFFYTHPPIGSMSSTGSDTTHTSSSLGPSYYQAAPYSTEPMKSWLESRAQSAAGEMVPTSLSLSLKTQTASSPAKGNGGKSHLSAYGGITPVGAWGLRHKTYAPEWHSSQSEKWALHTTTLANGELSTPQAQSRGERTAINSAVGRMPTPGTEEAHSLKAIQLKRAFRKHPGALFAVDPEILHLVGKRSLPDAMASLAPPHDSNPDLEVITLTHGQTGPDLSRSLLSNSWAKQRAKDLEAFPKQHFLLPGFQVSPITALYPAAKVFKSVPWWLRAGISDCTLDHKCGLFRSKKHLLGRKKATNLAPFLTSAKAVQPTAPPGMDKPIAAPLPRRQSGPGKHSHSNQSTPKAMVASALLEWQVCDFEEDLCSWRQSDTDDFDWILAGERPARSLPGGNVSDSPSGGNYISLRSPSARQTPGQKTALISPVLHGIGCISFWYSPLGSAMGTINLYIKLAGAPEWHRIWTAEGKQGLEWHQVGVAASESQKLQVMVEGVIGPEAGSDAGIDDLAICVAECQGGCEALLAFYKK